MSATEVGSLGKVAQEIKCLNTVAAPSFEPSNDSMSDILSNDAAWRKLFHAALCESDPQRLVQRIAAASSAVIDHIDSGFPNLSSAERLALHDALDMLISLQDMANSESE
jgi:hypothetical protein